MLRSFQVALNSRLPAEGWTRTASRTSVVQDQLGNGIPAAIALSAKRPMRPPPQSPDATFQRRSKSRPGLEPRQSLTPVVPTRSSSAVA